MGLRFFGLLVIGTLALANTSFGDQAADDAFFEAKVRPLLISKCLECHGAEKPKAGLRLDSREALLTGGESGPAAIIGKPDESLLVDVISYRNTVQMPPKSKLPDAEIAILTDWVRRGLPWPNSKPTGPTPVMANTATTDFSDDQKAFWAFQPVRQESPPPVKNEVLIRSPIDRFILAELEANGLMISHEVDRRALIRRVTLDLTGLPPTPEEVTEFVTDSAADALERLVDRLLASPRYGERWARHWLDVARYADSNGLDENLAYGNAFRYRDYVVKSMREDKPYDRFLLEQIAGDLLLPADANHLPEPATDAESFDGLIATGFLCLGAKMLAEDDPVKMQMDIIDEQVDTISRAVMGLTMGCARCHDHKFDPLSTEDYYGLAGIFKSTQTMDNFTVVARWHERPLASPEQLRHRDELQQQATAKKQAIEKLRADTSETILTEARQHAGDYLLAATREYQLAEQLRGAKPRGNMPDLQKIPRAILIEAEDYSRGNVLKDRETYGIGIGVLVNRGEAPNFTEYDFDVEQAGRFQFELRYAAAASRPVKVFVNGVLYKSDAAEKVTGSWTPETQTWFVEGFVSIKAGRNLIRLEQPQFFPHIDKLLLTPIEGNEEVAVEPNQRVQDLNPANAYQLLPSLTKQWKKVLEASNSDPKSILTAWHQYVKNKSLTIDPAVPDNGVAQLLGDQQPTSLKDLAKRYDQLCSAALTASTQLKAADEAQKAKSLPDPVLESARVLLSDPKGPFAIPADIEASFSTDVITQLKTDREELARREALIPKFPETMAVSDSKPENLKIHLRGSHLTLGREVPRKLPRILTQAESQRATDTQPNIPMSFEPAAGSGRLQLAQWLTRPEHPLTSRVMANRIWQWHFGQGLVRSPDNFGRLGERPSHPQLLDWLASEFSARSETSSKSPRAWSLKSLHRLLLGSTTYRQNTEFNSIAALADPENRLLWRFHRQRMDVEVLRDSLLQLSGQLDETPAGSLLPTANRSYVTSTANVNPAVYNSNRRSIYLPVVRSAIYEVFTAFDFADPSTLAGQRDQTTVAPQALFMMNSGFVLDQVRSLAGQLLSRQNLDASARIRAIYQMAYGREPSEAEVSRAIGYLDRMIALMNQPGHSTSDSELRAWTSLCRVVLSANEFLYVE